VWDAYRAVKADGTMETKSRDASLGQRIKATSLPVGRIGGVIAAAKSWEKLRQTGS